MEILDCAVLVNLQHVLYAGYERGVGMGGMTIASADVVEMVFFSVV